MNWQMRQWTNWKNKIITKWSAFFLVIVIFGLGFGVGATRTNYSFKILTEAQKSTSITNQLVVVIKAPTLVNGRLVFLVKVVDSSYYFKISSLSDVSVIPGDAIAISGSLKKNQSASAKNQSFIEYEHSQMVAGEINLQSYQLIKPAEVFSLRRIIFTIQNYLYQSADRLLPHPHNILTLGVLVGRSDFPTDLKQTFRTAGLSHIVVLSGFNLSIVVNALYAIYIDRLRYLKAVIGLLMAIILAAISGFGASALRALVMVSVAIYAKMIGRTYLAFRALIFSVAVLSLWRPLMLLYDVGFQLSVLATFGLIWLSPLLSDYLSSKKLPPWLSELIGGTLAAEIMVLPWLALKFGEVATYGLLANILVLPMVPVLMVLGFVLLLVGSFSYLLAFPISLITYLVSKYITAVAELINRLPFSMVNFSFTFIWAIIWYLLIIVYLIYQHQYSGSSYNQKINVSL